MEDDPDLPSQLAQRLAGFGTWRWDVATDSLVWSRELYRIYGQDPATFETRFDTFLGCLDPRDRQRVQTSIAAALRSGSLFEHEERIVRPSGEIRLLRSTGRIERDADGRPIQVMGACLDITEQRAAQVALAEREAELRLALSAAHMGTFTWRIENRRLMCSSEVDRLIGQPLPTIDALMQIMQPTDRERLAVLADRALRGQGDHVHLRFRAASGDGQRCLQLAGTLELGGAEPVIKGTIADITEQATLEAQLLQSQKMESVGRLAGGVAHDFNNLLTVILAELDLLRGEPGLGAHVHAGLQGINDAALRAAELTRNLLMLAREQPLSLGRVDVAAFVREAADLYARVLGERVELTVSTPRNAAPVLMDPARLGQLLLNLVTNADEAMAEGGGLRIAVSDRPAEPGASARHAVEAASHVVIEITDSGRGVPDEIVHKVFDPFFTTKERGTGLGLSTCYGIVQRHGGAIECASSAEGGTTFRVLLPRATGVEAVEPTGPARAPGGASETVLLAEDDRQLRTLTARFLSAQGYTVLPAADGEAALAVLDGGESIDILVTDVVMPRLGGVPLAKSVQARHPHLPVLFMSGYTADAFADGMPDGAVLLRKPFVPTALAARIRALLDPRADG